MYTQLFVYFATTIQKETSFLYHLIEHLFRTEFLNQILMIQLMKIKKTNKIQEYPSGLCKPPLRELALAIMSYIYSSAVKQHSPPEWCCFLRSWGCTPAGLLDGWQSAWSFDLMTPAGPWNGWKKNRKIRDKHVIACFTVRCRNPRVP